ncbi:MAG: hypothetical protein Q9170_007483 [Blastenia crenularia]
MSHASFADLESTTHTHPTLLSKSKLPHIPKNNKSPTSSAVNGSHPDENQLSERNLAQEAALRRLNGSDPRVSQDRRAQDGRSTASTQPVLVREYSQTAQSSGKKPYKMKKRTSTGNSSGMPSLESFSFQDILASIDPEIHGSIDKIAEICGRSKMSLADEYSSHLPPQGDFAMSGSQDHIDQAPISRLEPVEEASSTHEGLAQDSKLARTKAARLSLMGSSVKRQEDLSSTPALAASTTASYTHSSAVQESPKRPESQAPYLPQLLAWLRNSPNDSPRSSRRRDSGAANALQRILGGSVETTTN